MVVHLQRCVVAIVEEAPKAHAPPQADVPVRLDGPGADVQHVSLAYHYMTISYVS